MPRLSFYVLRQMIGPVALFTFLLTSVIWLSQSLRLLDLVINRGQSAPIFLYLTVLILPRLLVYILPMAFFAGTLFGLNKLNADSELVVMSAAGFSRRQLAAPVIMAAVIMMALTYLCSLYLMPLGERAMKSKVLDIRSDIGTAILNEGEFNTPTNDLTVFIRSLAPDGNIRGILVHDNRDTLRPTTYIAESPACSRTHLPARDSSCSTARSSKARWAARIFQCSNSSNIFSISTNSPDHSKQRSSKRASAFFRNCSGPARMSTRASAMPILPKPTTALRPRSIAWPSRLIAFAAVTRGRGGRGAYALRLTMACAFAGVIRIIGYGAQGAAARNPPLCALLYLVPLARRGPGSARHCRSRSGNMVRPILADATGGAGKMSWPWTLYRYLAVQFLAGVGTVFASFVFLSFSMDLVDLFDRTAGRHVSAAAIIGMSLFQLPDLGLKLLPFAVLLGGVFSFVRLSRSQELLAIRAAGVSAWIFWRLPSRRRSCLACSRWSCSRRFRHGCCRHTRRLKQPTFAARLRSSPYRATGCGFAKATQPASP